MRYFLLKRVDGKASVMSSLVPPDEAFAKWHPSLRAEYTGEYKEISEAEIPTGEDRHKWTEGGDVMVSSVLFGG